MGIFLKSILNYLIPKIAFDFTEGRLSENVKIRPQWIYDFCLQRRCNRNILAANIGPCNLVFHPLYKIRSRHPRELKLTGLIAYIIFYKICKFESSTITNDVIMTSLPKQWQNLDRRESKRIIHHSKGIDESYPKMYVLFIQFEPLCQKLWTFCQILAFFYSARSPNMVMSSDSRSKFRKCFILS